MVDGQRLDTDCKTCPVCRETSCTDWFIKNGHDHYRCPTCGHGFVCPVPSTEVLAAYYGGLNSGLSSDCSWATEPRHKVRLWKRLLRQVQQSSGKGPLVDLGCGAGQFLKVAGECGWHASTGVEISDKAAAMARDAVSAEIYESAWQDTALERNYFAAVALLDVLEHEPAPHALVAHVFELLRPGGSLIITVPNITGVSLRCLGKEAYVAIPPEHLSYFSRESLRQMLSQAGFQMAYESTCDIYLKEWLRFLPDGRKSSAPEASDADRRAHYDRSYRRMTGHLALGGISAVNRVLGLFGVGDQLVVVAAKPQHERDRP